MQSQEWAEKEKDNGGRLGRTYVLLFEEEQRTSTEQLDMFPTHGASEAMTGICLRKKGIQNMHLYSEKPIDPLMVGGKNWQRT